MNSLTHVTVMNANADPISDLAARLKTAGLRTTQQRLVVAALLFRGRDRHVTAEQLHAEAMAANHKVSLATIYNTLGQFVEGGLLRQVMVDPSRCYYDTNVSQHHHFYAEGCGALIDIPDHTISVTSVPLPPEGMAVTSVEVVIHIDSAA